MVVRVSRSSRRVMPSQMVSADSSSASVAAPDSAAADSCCIASTRRRCAVATGLSVTRSILLELVFDRWSFAAGRRPLGARGVVVLVGSAGGHEQLMAGVALGYEFVLFNGET